jgi:glycerophosphoryl diester phosphodiesterase/membrane-associated phospholipid phosphatase
VPSSRVASPSRVEPPAAPPTRRRRARLVGLLGVLALALGFLAQSPPRDRVDHFVEHRPSIIAHGGAQGHAPPNTIEAFAVALEMGADTLEMDTQITADGHVVLHHDGTVDRQTDGTGAIAELTLAEVRELDAGHGFIGEDGTDWTGRGTQIPTLDEVFAAFPDAFLVVELKLDGGSEIVEAVAQEIEAAGVEERVVVASFGLDEIQRFRERMPGIPTSMPEGEARAFYTRQLVGAHRWWSPPAELLQVPEHHEGRHVVTERFVAAANRLGIDVHVWTVNEPEDMRRLLGLGVHGIITDYPDRLAAVIAELPDPVDAIDPPDEVGGLHEAGLAVIGWSQDRLDVLTPLALAVTHLGDAEFYLLVFPLLYWSVSRRLGLRMGIILLLSASSNAIGKLGTATPRPFFLDPAVGRVSEASFGIPSGHAQNGVAVWGLLGHDIGRRWSYAVAGVLALALGLSRIHLGAHFPEDIIVGWVVGALLLLAFIRLAEPVGRWLDAQGAARTVGLVFAASLLLIATGAAMRVGLVGWDFPGAWIGATGEGIEEGATGLGDVVTRAAALFGLIAGVVLARAGGDFDSGGTVGRRVVRYLVGILGVLVLWQGLGALFVGGETVLALVLRYLRYAAIGVWIGGVAPLLFVQTGLAAPPVDATAPAGASSSSR